MFTLTAAKNKSVQWPSIAQETLDAWMLDFDTKLSDHPASTPLWECQNNTPSPISSFHPDELALMLTKPDSNTAKQNACCFCKSTNVKYRRIGAEELMLATLQQRFPPTPSLGWVSASDSLRLRLLADTFSPRPRLRHSVTISPLFSANIQSLSGKSHKFVQNKWKMTTPGTLKLS